jgi:hypothetical protein
MDAFNSFIETRCLRKIHRGARFTWSNNQEVLVLSNIDRVLKSTEWEAKYPLCTLSALTRIGSDHSPLLLNMGENHIVGGKHFFFEKQWCNMEGFLEKVEEKWV